MQQNTTTNPTKKTHGPLPHVITTNHTHTPTAARPATPKARAQPEPHDPDTAYIMANVHPPADALRLTSRIATLKRLITQINAQIELPGR